MYFSWFNSKNIFQSYTCKHTKYFRVNNRFISFHQTRKNTLLSGPGTFTLWWSNKFLWRTLAFTNASTKWRSTWPSSGSPSASQKPPNSLKTKWLSSLAGSSLPAGLDHRSSGGWVIWRRRDLFLDAMAALIVDEHLCMWEMPSLEWRVNYMEAGRELYVDAFVPQVLGKYQCMYAALQPWFDDFLK